MFWDLIQPSFMFLVGVSMPFSYSRRRAVAIRLAAPLRPRACPLAGPGGPGGLPGIARRPAEPIYSFTNVLAQIGLGYSFAFLVLGRPTGRSACRRGRDSARRLAAVRALPVARPWFSPRSLTAPTSSQLLMSGLLCPLEQERERRGGLRPVVPQPVSAARATNRSVTIPADTRPSISFRRSPR